MVVGAGTGLSSDGWSSGPGPAGTGVERVGWAYRKKRMREETVCGRTRIVRCEVLAVEVCFEGVGGVAIDVMRVGVM